MPAKRLVLSTPFIALLVLTTGCDKKEPAAAQPVADPNRQPPDERTAAAGEGGLAPGEAEPAVPYEEAEEAEEAEENLQDAPDQGETD